MMKYERPIMNISMFKLESIATTMNIAEGASIPNPPTNIGQAYQEGTTNIAGRAQRAMVVIRFNDGTTGQ